MEACAMSTTDITLSACRNGRDLYFNAADSYDMYLQIVAIDVDPRARRSTVVDVKNNRC